MQPISTTSDLKSLQSTVDKAIVDAIAEGAPAAIWNRDVHFWGKKDEAAIKSISNRLGWLDAPYHFVQEADDLIAFAEQIRLANFTHCVLLGMGGSSLCVEVFRDVMGTSEAYPRMHVLDSTHPDQVRATEEAIDLSRTLFIIASKSGTTLEPECLYNYFWEKVTEIRPDHPGSQFCAITDPDTHLAKLGAERRFVRVFTNPADIGGRYSALSLFGLLPAALMGIDVKRLLQHATEEADCTKLLDERNAALQLGITLGIAASQGKNKLTLITPDQFQPFGYWVEQLIAESTGKEGKGILPIEGEPFTNAELYSEDRLFVVFDLEGHESEVPKELPGPTIHITLQSTYDLAAQFFRWEFATAVAGKVLGINPFDEPNVTESKNNTNRVLVENTVYTANGSSARDLTSFLDEQVKPGAYIAIMAYLPRNWQSEEMLKELRGKLLQAYRVPVTVGFGPRFLHSTGQLHKGGPDQGVFIQFTADPQQDLSIPGKPFTFARLIQAQAQGDLESLRAKNRPVIQQHLA